MTRLFLPLLLVLGASAAVPSASQPITGRTLDGQVFSTAQGAGQVTVVSFWATWCTACRFEMPMLDTYRKAHAGTGLRVVAISLDDGGVPDARLRAATAPYGFAVARAKAVRFPRGAKPKMLPALRVYDRTGRLRFDTADMQRHNQPLDRATLEREVTPLLEAPAPG